MSHDEVQSLLGAYALHGVDPEEADAISEHLRTCPRCRSELDAYAAITPLLGPTSGPAPEGLWQEIVSTIEQAPPEGMVSALRREARPRSVWSRLGPALAVAAAAVVGILSYSVVHLQSQVNHANGQLASTSLAAPIHAALADPHRRVVDLKNVAGQTLSELVVVPGGQAYAVTSALPTLASGRTYQLWAIDSGRTVSVGLLGRRGSPAAFRVETGTSTLMVTAEPAGGVSKPDSAVLARSGVPATL